MKGQAKWILLLMSVHILLWCLMFWELNLSIPGHHFKSFSKTVYLLYFSRNGPKLHPSFPGYLTPFDHLFSVIWVVHMFSRVTETHFTCDDRIGGKLRRLQHWVKSSALAQCKMGKYRINLLRYRKIQDTSIVLLNHISFSKMSERMDSNASKLIFARYGLLMRS